MKKALVIGMAILLGLVMTGISFAALKNGQMQLKVGDEVYVCGCGEGCPCLTMSKNPGKCTCDKDLVKSKVTKVEKGKATVMVNGKPFTITVALLFSTLVTLLLTRSLSQVHLPGFFGSDGTTLTASTNIDFISTLSCICPFLSAAKEMPVIDRTQKDGVRSSNICSISFPPL